MPWSTPPDFTTGVVVTEGQLDTLSGDLNYLAAGSLAVLRQTATQTLTTSTETAITFTSEDIDVLGGHSTVTNTSRYANVTTTGLWVTLKGCVVFTTNATGVRQAWFRKNGSGATDAGFASVGAVGGTQTALVVCTELFLAAGDYVELFAWQSSGSGLATATQHGGSRLTVLHASF